MVFLSFEEVFNYLDAVPLSQCIREGQNVLNANHLLRVGIKGKSATRVVLFALCLKSSGLRDSPHEIEGALKLKNENVASIEEFTCSCKAGKSTRCKHIAALLFFCTRSNISDIEVVSSTDVECYWKKEKKHALKAYDPVPFLETPEVKEIKSFGKVRKLQEVEISRNEANNILQGFLEVAPNSSINKHKIGRKQNVPEDVEVSDQVPDGILKLMAWANQSELLLSLPVMEPVNECCNITFASLKTVDFAKIAFESTSNSALWRSHRQFRITGSRCYNLFTYSKEDWQMKSLKYFWPKSWSNKYVQHGIDNEQEARKCYHRQTNYEILEVGLVISERHPWLGYSPDGVVMENGQPVKLLEIKCPFLGKTKDITETILYCDYLVTDESGAVTLKKKHQYYGQIQLGMVLLNIQECDFIVYSTYSKSYIVVNIKIDVDFCVQLINKLQNIYFNNMLHEICKNKK